jgi:hypothetical protein
MAVGQAAAGHRLAVADTGLAVEGTANMTRVAAAGSPGVSDLVVVDIDLGSFCIISSIAV